MATLTIRFDDRDWLRTYGKPPRGHGSWAFDFGKGPEFTPTPMTYSEAKRWAVQYARARFAHLPAHLCSQNIYVTVCT